MVRKALSFVVSLFVLSLMACGGSVNTQKDVPDTPDTGTPVEDVTQVDTAIADTNVVEDVAEDVAPSSCTSNADCEAEYPDLDECSSVSCDAGVCVVSALVDGALCDDDNICTDNDSCLGGSCSGGTSKDCDDDNDCTENVCDDETAECLNPPAADGTGCDDGSVCTTDDICTLAECAGTLTVLCEESDPCLEGVCDPETGGCSTKPITGGGACNDGDECTVDDFCEEGACVSGLARNCQEELLPGGCQEAACVETGCVLNNLEDDLECDDNNACTGQGSCTSGECVDGTAVVECNPTIAEFEAGDTSTLDAECVVGACNAETGVCSYEPLNEGAACTDGTICSDASICALGGCVQSQEKTIDDNNSCTLDFCTNEGIHPETGQQILPGIHNWPMDNGAACAPENVNGIPCYSGGTCLYDSVTNISFCQAIFDESVPGCSMGDGCFQPYEVSSVPTTISGDTTAFTNQANAANCSELTTFLGQASSDAFVRFVAPEHGLFNFSLNTSGTLDALLYAMDRCPNEEGAVCLASVDEPGAGGELLSQSMAPGDVVYIVVDGPDNESNIVGTFELLIEKSDLAEVDCSDGLDNDADTLIDCDDSDCDVAPECHEFDCDDGLDNDGDELLDCADSDCEFAVACLQEGDSCEKPELITSALPAFLTGDTTGLNNLSDGGDCGGVFGGAPEYVFSYTPENSGVYRFSLDPLLTTFDSVLYLSSGCPAVGASCMVGADEWFTSGEVIDQVIASGDTVFVYVDGWLENDFGEFTLKVEMVQAVEAHCDDEIDDDGDSLVDCQDLDCSGDPACPSEGASCGAPFEVSEIPFVHVGTTAEMINNFTIPGLSCPLSFGGFLPDAGAASEDVVFHFHPEESGLFEISLALGDDKADLLIAVFVTTCPTGEFAVQCLAGDDTWDTGGDSVTMLMYDDKDYYIVLDGWSSLPEVGNVSGPYELHIDLLGPPTEINCEDDFDNDGDGFVDCDDPECDDDLACASIDISGYYLLQQFSTNTYVFPPNSVVNPGDYMVVARDTSKAQFEEHWQITLAPHVKFFNSASNILSDNMPQINGSETYELLNGEPGLPTTVTLDGPTIAMNGIGKSMQRTSPPAPPGLSTSWQEVDANIAATPGSGQTDKASYLGIYISEVSDAPGTGTFFFEFIELFYDGPAGE